RPRRSTLCPYTTLFRSASALPLSYTRTRTLVASPGHRRQVVPAVAKRAARVRRRDADPSWLGSTWTGRGGMGMRQTLTPGASGRSEEHTSELQSRENLV